MEIKRIDGKWKVNGKMYQDLTYEEQLNLHNFISYMKEAYNVDREIFRTEFQILCKDFKNTMAFMAIIFIILMVFSAIFGK